MRVYYSAFRCALFQGFVLLTVLHLKSLFTGETFNAHNPAGLQYTIHVRMVLTLLDLPTEIWKQICSHVIQGAAIQLHHATRHSRAKPSQRRLWASPCICSVVELLDNDKTWAFLQSFKLIRTDATEPGICLMCEALVQFGQEVVTRSCAGIDEPQSQTSTCNHTPTTNTDRS